MEFYRMTPIVFYRMAPMEVCILPILFYRMPPWKAASVAQLNPKTQSLFQSSIARFRDLVNSNRDLLENQ